MKDQIMERYYMTRQDLHDKITFLESSRETMKQYLMMKYEEEDWHGVCDASNDLRDVDSELKVYKKWKAAVEVP